MKKIFSIIILITFVLYFTINFTIGNNSLTTLKSYVSSENKFLIKKFFFPYNYISKLENEILRNKSRGTISELFFAVIKELDLKTKLKVLSQAAPRSVHQIPRTEKHMRI